MRTRRSYLTLIELLIVIGILSLIAGLIGVNIARAVRDQRFKSEVNRLVDKMRMAQDVMLILDIGATLKFEKAPNEEGIRCWMETSVPLPRHWDALINRPQPYFKSIHWIQFEDVKEEGKLELKFLSGGIGMSKGILRLSTSERDEDLGALSSYICLPGYPSPIVATSYAASEKECGFKNEEDFLRNLVRYTYDEIAGLPSFRKVGQEQNTSKEEAPDLN